MPGNIFVTSPSQTEGSTLPMLGKVMQTSLCPPLTDLHGEKFVGQASVAPKWQVLQGHQRIAALWAYYARFVWGMSPYLTHAKPLQPLPKTSPGDTSSTSRSPSAASPGQASSHASPPQWPTQWLCPSCSHLTQCSFLCERILHSSTNWLELALNTRQFLELTIFLLHPPRSWTHVPQVQQRVSFQVFKSIPSRSTSRDSAGCFLHTTNFIVRGSPRDSLIKAWLC